LARPTGTAASRRAAKGAKGAKGAGKAKAAKGSKAAKSAKAAKTAGRSTGAAGALPDKARRRIRALEVKLAAAEARIDELQAWADTDFLLDIYNRRGFERELARALAYMARYGTAGALVVLDVDRLKPINDTHGHGAGDVVLKGVVAALMRQVRSSDVVGRLGGDEFGVLLWNCSEADAQAKALALEEAIDRLTFVFKGRAVVAGASAGVTMIAPSDDIAAVMARADRAMYARKAMRRGTGASRSLTR
jgi:diguanylate cyclase (GGDEF)-like protein